MGSLGHYKLEFKGKPLMCLEHGLSKASKPRGYKAKAYPCEAMTIKIGLGDRVSLETSNTTLA